MVIFDISRFHPGYSSVDEVFNVIYAQLSLEGKPAPYLIATGSLLRGLQWLSVRLFGASLFSLHLPALAAFALENYLLWRLARVLYGARAAAGALLFNCVCAFSFIRARGLLSFSLFPCELLLVLNLLMAAPSRLKAFCAGLLAGLFSFDYEAWLVGGAVTAALALTLPSSARPWKSCWAGLSLGLGAALWLSADHLRAWMDLRGVYSGLGGGAMTREFFHNLKTFFLGGECISYLGPDGHPAIPRWSWIFLMAGVFELRKNKGIVFWLLLGLIPLALTSYGSEPNRAIAAWPALALLCGMGWRDLISWMETFGASFKRLHGAVLLAFLCLGLADESQAMMRSQSLNGPLCYGRSQSLIQAAAKIRTLAEPHGLTLLSDLDLNYGPEFRFLCGPLPSAAPGGPVAAWIPDGAMIQFKKISGSWLGVQAASQVAPERFLFADKSWAPRLKSVDAKIRGFHSQLPPFSRSADTMIFKWLDEDPGMDPWVRTALWARVMNDHAAAGTIDEKRLNELLREKLVSADPLYQPGIIALRAQPRLALRMLKAAATLDPRRKIDESVMIRIQTLAASEKPY